MYDTTDQEHNRSTIFSGYTRIRHTWYLFNFQISGHRLRKTCITVTDSILIIYCNYCCKSFLCDEVVSKQCRFVICLCFSSMCLCFYLNATLPTMNSCIKKVFFSLFHPLQFLSYNLKVTL